MSTNLDFVKRVTNKDYIDNFDDIRLVMDRVLQTTVFEIQQAGINTKANIIAEYIREDLRSCGKYLFVDDRKSDHPVESDTLQDMIGGVSVIWEYGKAQDALGHAQYILRILMETGSKLLWNKFFMRISVKSLIGFLKSKWGVDSPGRFCKKFCDDVERCAGLEINESTTMGDVLGRLDSEMRKPWCLYESIDKFSGKITDCCGTVMRLVNVINMAYNGIGRTEQTKKENKPNVCGELDDYPFSDPNPYAVKRIG